MEHDNSLMDMFSNLYLISSVAIVVLLSMTLMRRYLDPFFTLWSRGYTYFLATSILHVVGVYTPLSFWLELLAILTYGTATWYFVDAGYHILERRVPVRLRGFVFLLMVSGWGSFCLGESFILALTPLAIFNSIAFMWFGILSLRGRLLLSGGSTHWFGWSLLIKGLWIFAFPLFGGTRVYWLGSWIDGTLQLLVGVGMIILLLERNATQLQLLIDHIQHYAFFNLSPQGVVSTWNSGAERLIGYRATEIFRKPLSCLYPVGQEEAASRAMQATARHGTYEDTGWRVGKNGAMFWAHTIMTALRDRRGQLIGYSALIHDVTDRKHVEDERSMLAAAIQQTTEAIAVCDHQGRVRYVNRALELNGGRSAREWIGEELSLSLDKAQNESLCAQAWETLNRGEVWKERLVRPGGESGTISEDVAISPVRRKGPGEGSGDRDGESGAVTHYIMIRHDVTREVMLEEQLRRAQKMEAFGQLASGVAHGFGNLLAIITSYNYVLQKEVITPEVLAECTGALEEATNRATSLVRQLLTFTRRDLPEYRILDLNEVTGQAIRMLRQLIREDIELEVHLDPAGLPIKVDPGQIEQLLLNLALNARDAMHQGGRITFETRLVEITGKSGGADGIPVGHFALLSVRDNGGGIPASILPRIFEPFFTTKPAGKGTGLGLSIVAGIVEQSHGHIRVDSKPGMATAFRIYLPLAEKAIVPREAQAVRLLEASAGPAAILVVEDEPALRRLVSRILNRQGYTVIEATDGENALEQVRGLGHRLDLLLTDVVMPRMGGRVLAERMVQQFPDLRVLYMSGYTDDVIIHHGLRHSTIELIKKPFKPDELVARIQQALRSPAPTRTLAETGGQEEDVGGTFPA